MAPLLPVELKPLRLRSRCNGPEFVAAAVRDWITARQ